MNSPYEDTRRYLLRLVTYYRRRGKLAQVKGCQRDMVRLRAGTLQPVRSRGWV